MASSTSEFIARLLVNLNFPFIKNTENHRITFYYRKTSNFTNTTNHFVEFVIGFPIEKLTWKLHTSRMIVSAGNNNIVSGIEITRTYTLFHFSIIFNG